MAARTVTNAVSRTSVAIAALMVAVSVTIGVSVMITSFRSTVVNWLDLTLVADVYITAPGRRARAPAPVDTRAARASRAVPGVAEVEVHPQRHGRQRVWPGAALAAADTQRRRSAALYRFANGARRGHLAGHARPARSSSASRSPTATTCPLSGGIVTLLTDHGSHTFPVAAIYYDYSSDQGTILMSREVYHQYWDDRGLSGLAVYVDAGSRPRSCGRPTCVRR